METEEIEMLFKKYHEGRCSDEEKVLLETWYLQYNENDTGLSPDRVRTARGQVFRTLPGNHNEFLKIGFRLAAAAAVIGVLITIAVKLWLPQPPLTGYKADISPGTNKAVLTLSDGKRISLNDASSGRLAVRPGVRIVKKGSGEIIYLVTGKPGGIRPNNVTTPNGGQWRVVLPDGTKVWLNAASSFTYPTSFAGPVRVVQLSGEAYLEVAKDKRHPFIVKTRQQQVEVLGTHFNINAYPNELSIRTTLAEGRVKVSGSTGQTRILAPGQQAVLSGEGLTVVEADVEEALAWKNGYFRFNDERIQSVMRKLSRWYNIDVQYSSAVSPNGLNGKISRYKNISQVLNALEATKMVHFKMEGRRVTVMQ
ncbi:MAG: hypothetical protein JWP94_540 [Mucilaginibacter sp.]|nr:hypothetical protein [Mucilaginibacter sp.]